MYLHVFPKLSADAISAAAAAAAPASASKPAYQDQIINCTMKDFEGNILRRHCTTWLQRRRCLDVLESFNSDLQTIEDKMVRPCPHTFTSQQHFYACAPKDWHSVRVHAQCKSQLLSEQEQQLYGETDRDLIHTKMKSTVAAMKTLVQSKNIDGGAKKYLLKQASADRVVSV